MRWLVTGGLGVIGGLFAEERLRAGDSVTVIDAAEKPRNAFVRKTLEAVGGEGTLCVVEGRLERTDPQQLGALVEWADAIVHAAAHTGIPHSSEDPGDDWVSNVDATRALLEALRVLAARSPWRKVPTVIMSSVKPYRVEPMPDTGVSELAPLEADEPYAASKAAQSMIAMAYARTYDLPIVTLRFSNLYGPAPCHGPRHGWLTWFCIAAALGRNIEVQGGGMQSRDLLYSTDINAALRMGIEHAERLSGRVFNVGGGAPNVIGVRQAVEHLRNLHSVHVHSPALRVYERLEKRRHEDERFVTDHRAFTAETGWSPAVSPFKGAESVYEWALQNRDALSELY